MIYATEQQVVVTAVLVVAVGLIALCLGIWYGIGRGRAEAKEEARWARTEREVRRPSVWQRTGLGPDRTPMRAEVAHEAWTAHTEQALAVANGQAVTTGEIQAITAEMDAWLADHVYSAPTDYGAWLEQEDR